MARMRGRGVERSPPFRSALPMRMIRVSERSDSSRPAAVPPKSGLSTISSASRSAKPERNLLTIPEKIWPILYSRASGPAVVWRNFRS